MTDRYTELIDAAQEQQRENEERALAAVRANLAPQEHPAFDGSHCLDCDNLIPRERLEMGRMRCVSCQGALERNTKLFRR